MKTKLMLITAATALLTITSGCAAKRDSAFKLTPQAAITGKKAKLDYGAFAKIPDTATSFIYRAVLKTIPYTRGRAFHERYAGSGNEGGIPASAMDEIFRRHDIVYNEVRSARMMRWADEACVEALNRLDARELSPKAIEFRERTARFFTSRNFSWMGKPPVAFLYKTESRDCPFQTRADVFAFFAGKIEAPNISAEAQHKARSSNFEIRNKFKARK